MSAGRPPSPKPELVKQKTDQVVVKEQQDVEEHKDPYAQPTYKIPPKKLVEHIAANTGLTPEQIGTGATTNKAKIIATLISQGFSAEQAETTAKAVIANARVHLKTTKSEFTPEELAAHTMHGPEHTGGFNADGSVNEDVLKRGKEYAITIEGVKDRIITPENMERFRQERIAANKRENPPTCMQKMTAPIYNNASKKEIATSFQCLTTKKEGMTTEEYDDIYHKPYPTLWKAQDRKRRLDEANAELNKRLAPAAAPSSPTNRPK